MTIFVEVAGWLAAGFTLAAYAMRSMWWLRCAAVAANVAFITFSALTPIYPTLALHLALLPLNLSRLYEIWRATRRLKEARATDTPLQHLEPFLTPHHYPDGSRLFARGDAPDRVYFIKSGAVRLPELGQTLHADTLFGEMAYFTNAKTRMSSAVCDGDCEIMELDEATFISLFHQQPDFAFYVIRLMAQRLVEGTQSHPHLYTDFAERHVLATPPQ